MADKKEKEVQPSIFVTVVKGDQKLTVLRSTLASWLKNGYKETK